MLHPGRIVSPILLLVIVFLASIVNGKDGGPVDGSGTLRSVSIDSDLKELNEELHEDTSMFQQFHANVKRMEEKKKQKSSNREKKKEELQRKHARGNSHGDAIGDDNASDDGRGTINNDGAFYEEVTMQEIVRRAKQEQLDHISPQVDENVFWATDHTNFMASDDWSPLVKPSECRPGDKPDVNEPRLEAYCPNGPAYKKGRVLIDFYGRRGNTVCQYVMGWIIAEKMRWPLNYMSMQGWSPFPLFYQRIEYPPNHFRTMPPVYQDKWLFKDHTFLGMGGSLTHLHSTISLGGYFAKYEFFRGHREVVRTHLVDWCAIRKFADLAEAPLGLPGKDDLVIHHRGTDIQMNVRDTIVPNDDHISLPMDYLIHHICRSEGPRKVWLVHDSLWKLPFDVRRELREAGGNCTGKEIFYESHHGSLLTDEKKMDYDWSILFSAQEIVLSPSSFSWWAAWLGSARKIHYPVLGHFNPINIGGQQFAVDDDERYVYHLLEPHLTRRYDLTYKELMKHNLI
eukprot:TRINITY_DN6872_c0_g1_i2.p1 TRINITY_DN6872_c0_g1~~TRINITY_DN6872_c0_g1_i2.p1  ORF type:complete len:512 (+),score=111.64 TRINITY_DN6872_c0_g1_i2:199-1734(+)